MDLPPLNLTDNSKTLSGNSLAGASWVFNTGSATAGAWPFGNPGPPAHADSWAAPPTVAAVATQLGVSPVVLLLIGAFAVFVIARR